MPNSYVKFKRGSLAAYNALATKDADTLYFLYDAENNNEGWLYLGEKLISGPCSGAEPEKLMLNDLADVVVAENINYDAILMYNPISKKWEPYAFDTLVFTGASDDKAGIAGFVPAPGKGKQNYFLRGDGQWVELNTENGGKNAHTTFEVVLETNETHKAAQERAVGDIIPENGDILIIKEHIIDDKYMYTAYVYNNNIWSAMDGNYSADNVYLQENLTFTAPVGVVKIPESGSITINTKGKNLFDFMQDLFAVEEDPSYTLPSVDLQLVNAGVYEVGSVVTPEYISSYDEGTYSFNNTTGVNIDTWVIEDSNGNQNNALEGTMPEIVIEDTTDYSIKIDAVLSEGAIPTNNFGKEEPNCRIPQTTYSHVVEDTIKGYRKAFWGTLDYTPTLSDEFVYRDLNSSEFGYVNGSRWSMEIPKLTKTVIIAYPNTLRELSMVLDMNDAGTNIVSAFGSPMIVQIPGANGYDAIDYKVYILKFAKPYSDNNLFKIMI